MRTQRVTVEELCALLVKDNLLTTNQALDAAIKAESQKAKLSISLEKGINAGKSINAGKIGSKAKNERNKITAAETVAAMNFRQNNDDNLPFVDEDIIVRSLATHVKMKFVKIDPLKLDSNLITSTVSLPFARRTSVLPLNLKNNTLTVAVADPYAEELYEELRILTRMEISAVLSLRSDIQRYITEVYGFKKSVTNAAKEMTPSIDLGNLEQLIQLGKVDEIEATDKHVINAVEYILHYAFDQRASDIHIEPKRDHSQVRMRIDGILHDTYRIPKQVHAPVVSRIKMMSRLDLAERRRPQDGRFKTKKENSEVEMRVSSLPVAFGEKIVIRIFDPTILIQHISNIGFEKDSYKTYLNYIERPNGLILVTGPTGSGKTTTLYSTLRYLANSTINVTSIEDPIEMVIEDFNQIAIQPKIGVTFSHALRHILRQDPDVIMVGEIRDAETAQQAIQAALTGHLVISTLHTTDCASSVTRLLELDISPFLVASTLVGVVAQRLVRCICPKCKTETQLDPQQLSLLDIDLDSSNQDSLMVWEGTGCVYCRNTGFYGRTAIFEMLTISDTIRDLINEKSDATKIMRAARADGTITLRESAVRKLAQGQTSFEEVIKVTIDEDKR